MTLTVLVPCRSPDTFTTKLPWPTIVVKEHPYGAAIKCGLQQADTRYVITMDADGQHTVEDVQHLYDEWLNSRADMHIAKRDVRDGGMRSHLSAFLNLTASIMAGEHIPDFGSGLRIFDRVAALKMLPDLPDGFDFNAMLTMRFIIEGYSVAWSPTPSRPRTRGKSHIRWSDGVKVLGTLVGGKWRVE